MKTNELLKLLKKHGITFLQHGKKHDLYFSPLTGKTFPIPRHAAEVKTGTLQSILKDAGIEK